MTLPRTTDAVLDSLRGEPGGLTRAELVHRSGLSRPTVYRVVGELADAGVIRETVSGEGDEGQGAARLRLAAASGVYIGLDLGHGHISAVVGTAGAVVLAGPRTATVDVDELGLAALEPAMDLVGGLLEAGGVSPSDVVGMTVGVPAPLTPDRTIASARYSERFLAVDIAVQAREAFREAFGGGLSPTVGCENDANLGALGELYLGVARDRGYDNVVYVKASTGIGAGIVLAGEIWHGSHGLAGEFGHTAAELTWSDDLLAPLKPTCPRCLQRTCLENTVGTVAITRRLIELEGDRYPSDASFESIVELALAHAAEHDQARRMLVRAGGRIGRALADVVRLLDPDAVILGGLYAQAGDLVGAPIVDAVARAAIGEHRARVLLVPRGELRYSEARGALMHAIGASRGRAAASA